MKKSSVDNILSLKIWHYYLLATPRLSNDEIDRIQEKSTLNRHFITQSYVFVWVTVSMATDGQPMGERESMRWIYR